MVDIVSWMLQCTAAYWCELYSLQMIHVIIVFLKYTRCVIWFFFFFQAEDGIRDLVRSRGLGDVYKRQVVNRMSANSSSAKPPVRRFMLVKRRVWCRSGCNNLGIRPMLSILLKTCLLYTSDAADERSSVDLGGRRIIKKQKKKKEREVWTDYIKKEDKEVYANTD